MGEGPVEVGVDLPESEIWTYYNLQTLKGPKGLTEFYFLRGGSINMVLFPETVFTTLEPRQTLAPIPGGAARDYELTYVGRPLFNDPSSFLQLLHNSLQLGHNPFDSAELTSAVAEAERPSGDLAEERFRSRNRIREEISSAVFFDQLKAEARYWFLASADGYTYIPLALHVPGSVEGIFRRKDTLTAFVEIYQPGLRDGKPDLEITLRILQQGRPVGQAHSARLDYLTRDELNKVSYAIGLSLKSLQPDRYTIEAQIHDRLSGAVQSVSAPFELL